MFITKNAVRYFFAGIFFLFSGATNSFAGAGPDDENVLGFKTTALGVTNFDIVVNAPDGQGTSIIFAKETGASNSNSILNEDIYFFIILPDGNFITLTKSNGYKESYQFQKTANTTITFNINDMQVWAFKKNDPIPPPSNLTITPSYSGGGGTFALNNGSVYKSSEYLDPTKYVKVGCSWSPWDRTGAYYYMIVTYGNRGASAINGSIKLDSCTFGAVGFNPQRYTTFNLTGNNTWIKDQFFNDYTFVFSSLQPGEVRHIYVKMERNSSSSTIVPQFKATISGSLPIQISDCSRILLSTSPHDPNKKTVDQANCSFGGTGTLTYTVTFQNEGTGFAEIVIIKDQFHQAAKFNTLTLLSKSDNVPNISTRSSLADISQRRVTYTMGTNASSRVPKPYNLPGLAQKIPRRYSYDETIGWIQFKIRATCPGPTGNISPITNFAEIIFVGSTTGPQPVITTNTVNTQPDEIARPTLWPKGTRN